MPGTIGDEPVSTPFDGYPYLMVPLGASGLYNYALLPADWEPFQQEIFCGRQVDANWLDGYVCRFPDFALFLDSNDFVYPQRTVPSGIPVIDRLRLPEPIPETPEIAARHARLVAYAEANAPKTGYLVGDGLEGGRPATAEDRKRLSRRYPSGPPAGLDRCPDCGEFRGDYLAVRGEGNGDLHPRVIVVHCACQNHNRCAACGKPLAESRLSAYSYDAAEDRVWYQPAFAALSHRCP